MASQNNELVRGKKYQKRADGTFKVPWYNKVCCPFFKGEYCKGPKCMFFSVEADTCEILVACEAVKVIARKADSLPAGGVPADLVEVLAKRMSMEG